jgi:CheY-like chemotaxis protein
MSAWLEHAGYRVFLARDGLEGIALARAIGPSVILMDVALPKIDGWEAARVLRASPDTKDIPIIALTAMALHEDGRRARDAGVAIYLSKPVSLSRVLESVRSVVSATARMAPTTDESTILKE